MKSNAIARKKDAAIVPAALAINEAHREAITTAATAMTKSIERAIEVGRLLAEEKAKHNHGEWIPWIEANLDFNRKQAAAYMRAYEQRERVSNVLPGKTFDLGLKGALKLLAKPREKPVKRREPPEASVEVEDSDEDIDESEQAPTFGGDASDQESYLAAYLIRADQAARFAVYEGVVSRNVIAMARRVADAWTKLADQMEERS